MNRLCQIIAVVALWMAIPAYAVRNYSCDFESEESRDRWVLNPTANKNIYNNLANKWYVSEPGSNGKGSEYGLYISDDQGYSAHYTNNGCWVFAYDTITLDHLSTDNDYTLSFDYCAMGNMASNFDGLYLLWIPMTDPDSGDSIKVMSIATSSGTIPPVYDNYVIQLDQTAKIDYLNGTTTWKQCIVTLPNKKCDGKPHYLAFVWANGGQMPQQPGAKIDNIQITDTRPCDAPIALSLEIKGTTCQLKWDGEASTYEAYAYSYEADTWYGPKIVNGKETTFSNLPVGQTDFVVRAQCADDLYSLKTILSKLVYYPDQMCVDYLNLENARCYTGTGFNNTTTFNNYVEGPAVDNGPASPESRHTIHFDKNEHEPRSNGKLSTIPNGELASVRLGNWKNGNETERIEYSFTVDTFNFPVLLLKYAPILEAPDHKDTENPRFTLDMLIGNRTIGECGRADFNANNVLMKEDGKTVLKPEAEKQGWHITPKELAQANGADVIWKDWTTVGVNLKKREYQGKKLTVRLTTFDCSFTAHCGYAYFTLGCSDGKLKGMKCGAINPVFEAPEGFVYRWMYASSEKYREPDGYMPEQYVLGHDQTYVAGMEDDSLYVVDCMFVQDSSCFFSLYASTLATNPVSVMKTPEIQKNCREGKYTVKFDASPSWVQEIDHVTNDTLVSRIHKIDSYEWNVEGIAKGWSDEISPTFEFPEKGGNFMVSLRTTSGICDSTIYYMLRLDSLGPTRDTLSLTLCDEMRRDGYVWKEKPDTVYRDYGLDSIILLNPATTCDSILYLELTAPHRVYVDTILLPEELPFDFHGRSYDKTMVDTIPISPTNCDTTWILDFEVYESLLANMPVTDYKLCEDDNALTLVYDITRGRGLSYDYAFEDASLPAEKKREIQRIGHYELLIPLNPMPKPNVYNGELVLEDSIPKWNVHIPFSLTVQYASSIITQRWNDVLAIRNAEYNGGYQFDSVQWYVNGSPIEGATDFNYYTGEGKELSMGSEYTALLTRNDGVKLFACVFVPSPVSAEVKDLPTLVPPSEPMRIKGKGKAYWYDTLGRTHHMDTYDDSHITAPGTAGYYLLVLQEKDTRSVHRIMVK